jgi:hypothetical protein
MVGRLRRELSRASGVEATDADEDCANAVLRKICESGFDFAIGSGIINQYISM